MIPPDEARSAASSSSRPRHSSAVATRAQPAVSLKPSRCCAAEGVVAGAAAPPATMSVSRPRARSTLYCRAFRTLPTMLDVALAAWARLMRGPPPPGAAMAAARHACRSRCAATARATMAAAARMSLSSGMGAATTDDGEAEPATLPPTLPPAPAPAPSSAAAAAASEAPKPQRLPRLLRLPRAEVSALLLDTVLASRAAAADAPSLIAARAAVAVASTEPSATAAA